MRLSFAGQDDVVKAINEMLTDVASELEVL